jgi:hypothetical protein
LVELAHRHSARDHRLKRAPRTDDNPGDTRSRRTTNMDKHFIASDHQAPRCELVAQSSRGHALTVSGAAESSHADAARDVGRAVATLMISSTKLGENNSRSFGSVVADERANRSFATNITGRDSTPLG